MSDPSEVEHRHRTVAGAPTFDGGTGEDRPAFAAEFATKLKNSGLVKRGAGKHSLQEDDPTEIAHAAAAFIAESERAIAQSKSVRE